MLTIGATRAENLGWGGAKAQNFFCLEYIFALNVDILPIFGGYTCFWAGGLNYSSYCAYHATLLQ